jgi:PAS domain S-box-containing protein
LRARNDALREALVVGSVLALLCPGFWWILQRTLTARVGRLVGATQQIAGGNLNVRTALRSGDELEEISEGIDRMAGELSQHITALRESEKRLWLALDAAHMGTWEWDFVADKTVEDARAQELVNVSADGLTAFLDTVHPEDRDLVQQKLKAVIETKGEYHAVYRIRKPDGEFRWVEGSAQVIADGTSRAAKLVGVVCDITEQKQAEEKLRKSEDRLRGILNSIEEVIWSTALDRSEIYFISPAAEQLYGRPVTDFYATPQLWLEAIHPDDRERIGRAFEAETQTERFDEEYRIVRLDGGVRWVHDRGHYVYDEKGKPLRTDGVVSDITERKQAQAALQVNEARMAGIIDSATDAIISVNEEHRIVLFNHAAERMFGYATQEMIGAPLARLLPETFRATHDEHICRFGETGTTTRAMGALGTVSGLRRSGEEFPIEASISQIQADGEKLFTVILRDITARKEAAEKLIEQAALLNHAQEAILLCDLAGQILFWNRGAERIYGWSAEEVTGRNLRAELYHGDFTRADLAQQELESQGRWAGELRQYTRDGREIIIEGHWTLVRDDAGNPKSALIINNDITEKKKLEQQYLRAQRLESIGALSSGIAHDLNNILSPILMAVQLLQKQFTDERSQRLLGMLEANAERGGEMIKQVLSFARGIGGEGAPLQPGHLIREIIRILKETFPKSIVVESNVPTELLTISGDATQIHQVLMNLCVNARDAMPHGGTLRLEAENTYLDEQYASMVPDAQPGAYVIITISDTGTGIPAEIRDKIFDPFFTTKAQGTGTGLGLSTVAGIVKSHGGFVNVSSEPGEGTQFKVYLPALESSLVANSTLRPDELPAGQGELILVVDDETAIREITRETLEAHGYHVLTASDGAEALTLYADHKGEIRLTLTDLMMPFVDGPATIRALKKINPEVRIIASSGLAESQKLDDDTLTLVNAFILKPYSADKLLTKIAEIIG